MTIDETLERIMNETDIGTIHALAMSAYDRAKTMGEGADSSSVALQGEIAENSPNEAASPATSDVEMVRELVKMTTRYRQSFNALRDIICFHDGNNGEKLDCIRKRMLEAPLFEEYHETITKASAWLAEREK